MSTNLNVICAIRVKRALSSYSSMRGEDKKRKEKRISEANVLTRRAYVHRSEISVTILSKENVTRRALPT